MLERRIMSLICFVGEFNCCHLTIIQSFLKILMKFYFRLRCSSPVFSKSLLQFFVHFFRHIQTFPPPILSFFGRSNKVYKVFLTNASSIWIFFFYHDYIWFNFFNNFTYVEIDLHSFPPSHSPRTDASSSYVIHVIFSH